MQRKAMPSKRGIAFCCPLIHDMLSGIYQFLVYPPRKEDALLKWSSVNEMTANVIAGLEMMPLVRHSSRSQLSRLRCMRQYIPCMHDNKRIKKE